MTAIDHAVNLVVERVRKTSESVADALRAMRARVVAKLSASQRNTLLDEALIGRISDALRNPTDRQAGVSPGAFRGDEQALAGNGRAVHVTVETVGQPSSTPVSVSVTILHDTVLSTLDGARKALVHFTVADCYFCIGRLEAQSDGLKRQSAVLAYISERLRVLGKKEVSQLATGEQSIIARKWASVRAGEVNQEPDAKEVAEAAGVFVGAL